MLAVSNAFNEAFKQDYRDIKMRIKINDVTYTDSDIISFNYNAGSIVGESFAIGSTFANTIKLTLCKIVEGLKQLDEVIPEMGIVVADGSTEFVKLGTFIISEQVNPDRNENRTSIECTDRMIMLDDPYESKLPYPAKIRDVALEIANLAGVEVDQVSFGRLMDNTINEPKGYTFRQALGLIAQFEAGYACFDRNGLLAIRQLEDKDFRVTPAEYFQKGLVKNELLFRPAGIQVKVNGESEEDKILKIGNEKGSVINLENRVMTEGLLRLVYEKIKDINYYPYSLNWRGNPAVEVGDWLRVTDLKGNQFKVPNLSYSLEYKGGLTAISTVETVASNEVRFAYKGILDQVIEHVDNVIKNESGNNIYYGVEEPTYPKEGDAWFKKIGPDTEVWVYEKIGEPDIFDWVFKISTTLDDTIKEKIEDLEKVSKENTEKADQALKEAEKSREEAEKARQEAFDSNTIARQAERDALEAIALGDGNRTKIETLEGEQKLTNVKVEGNTVNILSLHSNAESLNLSLGKLESDIADKITAVVIEYYESISETSLIGGFWTELPPKKQDDNYIFTRNKIIYSGKIEYKPSENGVLMSGKDAKTNYIHTAYADNSDGTEGFTFEGSEESFIVKNYDSNTSDKWKTVTINKPKPKYVTIDILYKDENNYIFKRESEECLEGSTQYIFANEVDGYQIEGESYKKIIVTEGTVVEFYFRKKIVENNFLVDDGYPVNMTSKSSGYEEFSAFNFKTNLANCGKVGDKLSLSFKVDRVASSGSYFLIKTNGLSDLSGWLSYGELKVGERYTVTFDFKSEYASATTSTSINFLLTGMKLGDITSVSEPKLINLSSIKVKAYQKNTKLFSEIVLNSEFSEEILVTEVYMSSAFLNNTCMYSLEIDSNEDVRIECYFVDEFDNYYDTFYSPYTRTGFLEIRLKPTTKTKKMKFLLVGKDNKEATVKFKKSQFEIGDSRHEWLSYGESIEIGGYKEYIGTYTDFNEQASTDPSKYFWRWNPRREDLISQAEFANFEANHKGFQTTVTSDITGLQSQQTQMAGQISSVVKDVNGLETEVIQLSNQWAVTAQEVKTIDGIVSKQQASIAVLTSQIDLKVNDDEVISRINLSPEQILIKSKLIHLAGDTLIDDAVIKNVHIANGAIDTIKIQDASITDAKIISVKADKVIANTLSAITTNTGNLNVTGWLSFNTTNRGIKADYDNGDNEEFDPKWLTGEYRMSNRLTTYKSNVHKVTASGGKGAFRFYSETFLAADTLKLRQYVNEVDRSLLSRVDVDASRIQVSRNWEFDGGVLIEGKGVTAARFFPSKDDYNTMIFNENYERGMGRMQLSNTNSAFKVNEDNRLGYADFVVGKDSSGRRIASDAAYSRTYSYSPNMYVTVEGTIGRSTSARKYKFLIEEADSVIENSKNILSINPKKWYDKMEIESISKEVEGASDIEKNNKIRQHYGFVAEDFYDTGLNEVVTFDENGEIEGLAYDRITMYHNVILSEHEKEIKELNKKIQRLEERLEHVS